MTRVVIHEAALRHLTRAQDGPTGIYLARKAAGVATRAHQNAAGRPGPRIRSGDLQAHLRFAGMFENERGLYALVGTDAMHRGFAYPRALETGVAPGGGPLPYRYPFLEPALKAEFGKS
jgi:hypothetical protein